MTTPHTTDAGYEELEDNLRAGGLIGTADAIADMRRQRDEAQVKAETCFDQNEMLAARIIAAEHERDEALAGCKNILALQLQEAVRADEAEAQLTEARAVVERLTTALGNLKHNADNELGFAHDQRIAAERERDRYKALAEGERERVARHFDFLGSDITARTIRALPAPSLPEEPDKEPSDA